VDAEICSRKDINIDEFFWSTKERQQPYPKLEKILELVKLFPM
jgi:hypothetical protein